MPEKQQSIYVRSPTKAEALRMCYLLFMRNLGVKDRLEAKVLLSDPRKLRGLVAGLDVSRCGDSQLRYPAISFFYIFFFFFFFSFFFLALVARSCSSYSFLRVSITKNDTIYTWGREVTLCHGVLFFS